METQSLDTNEQNQKRIFEMNLKLSKTLFWEGSKFLLEFLHKVNEGVSTQSKDLKIIYDSKREMNIWKKNVKRVRKTNNTSST